MKKALSMLLALVMLFALLIPGAMAAEDYSGKVVVIATANLKGDVDVYAKVAAAKADYQSKGAKVLLLDAGNYLQGSATANADRGETIFKLMDAAGYDAAAMGAREFYYGDASTGQKWHGNLYFYYTQAELLRGSEQIEYAKNGNGSVTGTRAAKDPATFAVLSTNITKAEDRTGYYDFDATKTFFDGAVGVFALTDTTVPERLQDNFTRGYTFAEPDKADVSALKDCGIVICLNNADSAKRSDATLTINAPADGKALTEVYVIDEASKSVSTEAFPAVTPNADVQKIADSARTSADASLVGVSSVILNGADRIGWKSETNLGDLVTDALKWYAENKFDGFAKDAPVIAIQNGGNCDQFIYDGDVTTTDLLRAFPFSPMGVGILYIKGADLLTILEAGTSPSERYGFDVCPGFAQVSGLEYEVHAYKEYLEGDAYGYFFKHTAVNRVNIKSVAGQAFDPEATYALIADNYVLNGNDTYYRLSELREDKDVRYLNNGNGTLTRNIVEMYIEQVLKGKIGDAYAEPQGRVTVLTEPAPEKCDGGANCASRAFTDVDRSEKSWSHEAIDWAVVNEITNGVSADKFGPDNACTREQVVTFLWRAAKCPEPKTDKNPFTDVKDNYAYKAILWAVENGITKGTSETTFTPSGTCTREQFVTFLWRFEKEPKAESAKNPFTDVTDNYAYNAILWAVENDVTNGMTATTFVPQGTCTRAQVVTFLWRDLAK